MSDIVKPIIPEGCEQHESADDQVLAFFKEPREFIPIPKELADEIRSRVLQSGEHAEPEKILASVEKTKSQPQAKPKAKSAEQKSSKPTGSCNTQPPVGHGTNSEPYWEPCSKEAQKTRRWKQVCLIFLVLSILVSLMWLAIQTNDASPRLAISVIVGCYLAMGGSLLWTWIKK